MIASGVDIEVTLAIRYLYITYQNRYLSHSNGFLSK